MADHIWTQHTRTDGITVFICRNCRIHESIYATCIQCHVVGYAGHTWSGKCLYGPGHFTMGYVCLGA